MSVETKVIYQGVKFYWRTRNSVDVIIVEHGQLNTTELVLFDPALGREAPRIYLSSPVLLTKLDHDNIELQLSFAKRNSVPITEKFLDGIMNKAKSDFILSHLVITDYSAELKTVVVSFQFSDMEYDCGHLICEKSVMLEPYKPIHFQSLMAGVVDQAIAALQEEKDKLHTECDKALELEKIAESSTKPLTTRERWRIPIVFIKASKGKRLNVPDAKIWTAVTQNMRTEEDAANMAAVLAHNHSKSAPAPLSRTASFSATHRLITPCETPRHSTSKLLQDTVATTRHRSEIPHPHSLSRQSSRQRSFRQTSFRQSDLAAAHTATGATEGHITPPRSARADEDRELTPTSTSKKSKASAAGKSHKKHGTKSKKRRKTLFGRLCRSLKLSVSPAAGKETIEETALTTDGDASSDNGDCANCGGEGEQGTVQLLIAGLGELGTTLRTSFLGATQQGESGKSGKSGTTKSATTKSSGDTSAVPALDLTYCASNVSSVSDVHNATVANATQKTQSPQRKRSICIDVAQPPDDVEEQFFDTNKPSAGGAGMDIVSKQSNALFSVHKFFGDLVQWRGVNRIYADAAQE